MSLWDLGVAEPARLALLPRGPARASFSPDGRLLATATGTLVTLWNLTHPASPTELSTWNTGGNTLADLTVTDDGTVLTSGDQALVTRWRPLADEPSQVLVADVPAQGTTVNRLVVDAEAGRALVSVAAIGTGVSLYDLTTGKIAHTYFAGPDGLANKFSTTWVAAADPDMAFIVAFDLVGRGYAYRTDDDDNPLSSLVGGHTATVAQADVTPDGLVVTGAIDGTIRVWEPRAASDRRERDVRRSLCAEFGARIDDGSQTLALGDEDFNGSCPAARSADDGPALDLDSDLPEGAPASAVLADDFEEAEGLFTVGSYPIADGITLSRSVSGGRIQVSVAGGAADYHTWSQLPLGITPTAYDARVRVVGIARGRCGLTVGDGNTRVDVVVDPSAGAGTAVWFVGNRYDHETGFAFPPRRTASLSVSPDGDALVVRVDGDLARRLRDAGVGPAVDAGLATLGGTASCTFDDFAVTLP
jgi:WD40 repeat protein